MSKFTDFLRFMLEEAIPSYSHKSWAEALPVTEQKIADWLSEKGMPPSPAQLTKILRLIHTDVDHPTASVDVLERFNLIAEKPLSEISTYDSSVWQGAKTLAQYVKQ